MTEKSKIPDHPDLEEMEWECDELGVTLTCFFEYEPEERGSREFGTGLQLEPDYPATFTLVHVYTPEGLDISAVMKLGLIDEIEQWAADKFEQDWEQNRAEAAYDRWLDRQYEGGGL
jgi:hypothetical protein